MSAATGAQHPAVHHRMAHPYMLGKCSYAHPPLKIWTQSDETPLTAHASTSRLVACRRGHAAVLPADAEAAAGPALHAQRQRAADHERSPHPCEPLSSCLQWACQHVCLWCWRTHRLPKQLSIHVCRFLCCRTSPKTSRWCACYIHLARFPCWLLTVTTFQTLCHEPIVLHSCRTASWATGKRPQLQCTDSRGEPI